jgi:hypothetical protein
MDDSCCLAKNELIIQFSKTLLLGSSEGNTKE